MLQSTAPGESNTLLGDFKAHVGMESETWNGVQLLEFCAVHRLTLTTTMSISAHGAKGSQFDD